MSVHRRLLDRAGQSAGRSGSFTGDPVIEAGRDAIAGLAALVAARHDGDLAAGLGLDTRSRVLPIGSEGVTDPAIFDRIMEVDHVV